MLKQYKRKLVLENIIKGSLWGLALGLVVSAILVMSFLLAKLTTWPYITIEVCGGVLAMLVTAVVYCVVRNPKEGDVAKRIDFTYDLKEKCATMVEFQGKSSFLIDRQREDAKVEVKKQNPKKMTVKLAVWTLPAIVLGASLLTTSLFTNQIKEGFNTIVNPGNNGKDFNDRTEDIIKDIEDFISKSDASEEFKQELFAILEKLQADLENDTDIASRTEKVKDAQGQVDDALNRVNVKEEIGLALQTHGDTFFIKVGIGMFNGDTGISDNQIITDGFHWLEDNTEIKKSATNKDKDGYLTMYPDGNEYLKPYSLSDIRSDGAKLGSYLDTWAAHIDDSLKASKVESTDEIYGIFNILSTKLKAYSPEAKACGSSNGAKITTLKQGIYTAFEQALSDLITDVQIENSNTALAEEVKKKMEDLIDPTQNGGGGSGDPSDGKPGDNKGDQDGNQGNKGDQGNDGDSGSNGDSGDQDGDQGNQGNQGEQGNQGNQGNNQGNKGDGQNGSQSNGQGQGSGGQQGEGKGEGKGDGAGGGEGNTNYRGNDKVYTGDEGSKSYGEVIKDYQGQAANDAKDSGDSDVDSSVSDYFKYLYGGDNSGDNSGSGSGNNSGTGTGTGDNSGTGDNAGQGGN